MNWKKVLWLCVAPVVFFAPLVKGTIHEIAWAGTGLIAYVTIGYSVDLSLLGMARRTRVVATQSRLRLSILTFIGRVSQKQGQRYHHENCETWHKLLKNKFFMLSYNCLKSKRRYSYA